jgi:hypothetical protein
MLYYCAGASRSNIEALAGQAVLISYVEKDQLVVIAARAAGIVSHLMLDNGAFATWKSGKAPAELAAYIAFIHANRAGIDHALALDVIPGTFGTAPTALEAEAAFATTLANFDAMMAAGLADVLVPVAHLKMADARLAIAHYIAAGCTYIALGGTVGAPDAEARPWVEGILAEYPGIRFHLLGCSKKWALATTAASCDSTTWLQLNKNGFAKNRYLVRNLPASFYAANPRAVALAAADSEDLGLDMTQIEKLRLGALAMAARVSQLASHTLPAVRMLKGKTPFTATKRTAAMRIVLVACAAQKVDHTAPAALLYTSDLFIKSAAYARHMVATGRADAWYILSAEHHLVDPATMLAPYDKALTTATALERRAWGHKAARQVLALAAKHVTFLAGRDYRDELALVLEAAGVTHDAPMAGLGIGSQKGWLKGQLDAAAIAPVALVPARFVQLSLFAA